MSDQRFPRAHRLLTAGDYRSVFDRAERKASHRTLLLLATRNELGHHRLGLVVAKKHVRLAIQRNRIKRLARESFRALPPADCGWDIVFLARRGIDRLDNATLSSILRQQWQKLIPR